MNKSQITHKTCQKRAHLPFPPIGTGQTGRLVISRHPLSLAPALPISSRPALHPGAHSCEGSQRGEAGHFGSVWTLRAGWGPPGNAISTSCTAFSLTSWFSTAGAIGQLVGYGPAAQACGQGQAFRGCCCCCCCMHRG